MDNQLKTLVEGAIAGDKSDFAELLAFCMKDILYFAMLRSNAQEAEDIAQEVSIILFNKIHKLRDPERFHQWVAAIVHNTSVNHMRKLNKTTNSHIELESYIDEYADADERNVENMEFLPDQYVQDAELREIVLEEIEKLPKNQRICLSYFYLYEFKRKDISEATGFTPRQVSTGLNYGKKTLKKRMEKRLGEYFTFSLVPAGAIPALAYIFRAERAAAVSPEWSAQVAKAAIQQINLVAPAAATTAVATKVVAGVVTGILATSLTLGLVLNTADANPGIAEPDPLPPPAIETPAEPEIVTLADMIGADQAGMLENFVASGTDEGSWLTFIEAIGAELDEVAEDYDDTYCIYILEKQDKRLLLAAQTTPGGGVGVLYRFGSETEPVLKMPQVILLFETESVVSIGM